MIECNVTGCHRPGWEKEDGQCSRCFRGKPLQASRLIPLDQGARDQLPKDGDIFDDGKGNRAILENNKWVGLSATAPLPEDKQGPFPDGHPDMWFVEAVPFALELLRYLHRTAPGLLTAELMRDLEVQETEALDLVRDFCLETVRDRAEAN